jgi:hypothetical protein
MEDTKIISAYKQLARHLQVVDTLDKQDNMRVTELVQAIHAHMHAVQDASNDANVSFNASEQIQSLHLAQKELDLVLSDIFSLKDLGLLSESNHQQIANSVRELDTAIRAMSDPEYSYRNKEITYGGLFNYRT